MPGPVATREEWLAARQKVLEKEKQAIRLHDELRDLRSELPMVKIEKDYAFEGPNGKAKLADLFEGRRQLVLYHFMFAPEWEKGCKSCSFLSDHWPDQVHLNSRDTTFAAVSRAPLAKLDSYKEYMGWKFPWYSAHEGDFTWDFDGSMDDKVQRKEMYNFEDRESLEKKGWGGYFNAENPGFSVFFMGDDGNVYHTYSAYARGTDMATTNWLLDMTPWGRQDKGMKGGKPYERHNEY